MRIKYDVLFLLLLLCLGLPAPVRSDIMVTKHNLSTSGPGTNKASGETRICVFCHTPHQVVTAKPLWNHTASVQTFIPYDQTISTTLKSNPGQPDGSSKLCLGCHDGTVALGATGTEGNISGLGTPLGGPASLGTNLSNSHPVSFVFDSALTVQKGELVDPVVLTDKVKLDANSKLQCTSCHDPHDNSNGNFLVMGNSGGALCTTCHVKTGWSAAAHKTSAALAGAGCNACHQSHKAGAVPLLKKSEVALCFDCHGSAGPGPVDIQAQFSGTATLLALGSSGKYKTVNTHHDVSDTDHTFSGSKITCDSCHNPHLAQKSFGSDAVIESIIDPWDRKTIWGGAGALSYPDSATKFCLSCHGNSFPPAVASPAQSIAPSSPITNIATAYETNVHEKESIRPCPNNPASPVAAISCLVCHASHGSNYSDQSWAGNLYHFNNVVDGTSYVDNGAEFGGGWNWPYVPPSSVMGTIKNVRINPSKINIFAETNNIYNLCGSCHSKTSGPNGTAHNNSSSYNLCDNCHFHGTWPSVKMF